MYEREDLGIGGQGLLEQYDDYSAALDVLFKLEGLHLQAEWVHRQRVYTEEGRRYRELGSSGAIPADRIGWGAYALAGYRLPWLGIMPYVMWNVSRGWGQTGPSNIDVGQVGLNVRVLPDLVLKAEYAFGEIRLPGIAELDLGRARGQIAWAF